MLKIVVYDELKIVLFLGENLKWLITLHDKVIQKTK